MTAPELVATLLEARRRLLDGVGHFPVERVTDRPAGDEWCVLEVLAHLIDVDHYWLSQALAIRDTPGHLFVYFDDEGWKAEHTNVRQVQLGTVLEQLKVSHQTMLESLSRMTEEELGRQGKHPRGIPYTVADVFSRYHDHDDNHRQQILDIRKGLGI